MIAARLALTNTTVIATQMPGPAPPTTRIDAAIAWATLPQSMIRCRSQRSTYTPATGPTTTDGRAITAQTMPARKTEPVSSSTKIGTTV